MNFFQLNIIFLAVAALVLVASLRSAAGGARNRTVLAAVLGATVVLMILTAIFDNVMIASGLFDYGEHTLQGIRLGWAPLEDFAYPLGAAMLLPGLWLLFTRRRP